MEAAAPAAVAAAGGVAAAIATKSAWNWTLPGKSKGKRQISKGNNILPKGRPKWVFSILAFAF
jgi:hypothetical protein